MEKLESLQNYAVEYTEQFIAFLPTLLGTLAILIIGWWIINLFVRKCKKIFAKREYDLALQDFLAKLINVVLKVILIVIVVSQLGVETASLIAIIGAAGLAIGLALQGSLANFAGGIIILALKPFKIGDWIAAQGESGEVKQISLFYTRLISFGNQLIIIPNGQLTNNNVINYTVLGRRKDALTFGIGYNDDIEKAKKILMDLMTEQKGILKDPAPEVVLATLGDNCVNLSARFWADNSDFWDCHWYTIEQAKYRLEAAGMNIPYPQRDVHHFYPEKNGNEESPQG